MVVINQQDLDKIFKAGEEGLRNVQVDDLNQERKKHIQDTDLVYHEGVVLYQQQRFSQAQEVLSHVEDSIPYYKSSDALLKGIVDQKVQETRPSLSSTKLNEDSLVLKVLEQKSSLLYHQAARLGNNGETAAVKKKLNKLMMTFKEKYQRIYIQQQLDKIALDADAYDQAIFKLTQAKDYVAAQKMYAQFQQAMINELGQVKRTVSWVTNRTVSPEIHDEKYWKKKLKFTYADDH